HRDQMIDLIDALKEYFRDDPKVYVTGNIFVYFRDESGEIQPVSPDVFVVRGIEKKDRRIYHLEKEGRAPDMVIEVTSKSTKMENLGNKRFIYAYLGVKEYFLFDPLSETLRPALRGYRLKNGDYAPMMGTPLKSEVLELELRVENGKLRLHDPKTGERLLTHAEAQAARRAATAKAMSLEAENVLLRKELARLQKQK
ncbi:MAG: Uma2 family endonuclease, partial [bacterium]